MEHDSGARKLGVRISIFGAPDNEKFQRDGERVVTVTVDGSERIRGRGSNVIE